MLKPCLVWAFQLHEFMLADGEKAVSIGHSGLVGVVVALPEEEVVLALTLNHLNMDSLPRKRFWASSLMSLGGSHHPAFLQTRKHAHFL